jgi:hypothetical protein
MSQATEEYNDRLELNIFFQINFLSSETKTFTRGH